MFFFFREGCPPQVLLSFRGQLRQHFSRLVCCCRRHWLPGFWLFQLETGMRHCRRRVREYLSLICPRPRETRSASRDGQRDCGGSAPAPDWVVGIWSLETAALSAQSLVLSFIAAAVAGPCRVGVG